MKIFIQILFFISLDFLSYGQYDLDRYELDSLQIFSEDKLTYEFNLHGPSQGLFFDRYVYNQLPSIYLKIYNNSKDTIIKKYREKDAHLMWIRVGGSCGSCDTMAPNDYFILKSGWAGWGNRPAGSFNTSLEIQTQIGDSVANSTIRTWGAIYPEEYAFDKVKVEQKVPEKIDTIRNKEISLNDLENDTFKGLHYCSHTGKKKINATKVSYYTPRLISDGDKWIGEKGKKYLDSLNTLFARYDASIKWAQADGMVITCDAKDAAIISKKLGKRDLYIMPGSHSCLSDQYQIVFKKDLTKEEITAIFHRLDLKPTRIEDSNVAYIRLTNSPSDNNNSITDQLAKIEEIQSIIQMETQIPTAIGN